MSLLSLLAFGCGQQPPGSGVSHLGGLDPNLEPQDTSQPVAPGVEPLSTEQLLPRTWVVSRDGTGDFTELSSAVAYAGHGDTILVAPGLYIGPVAMADKAVSIIGQGAAEDVIIEGAGADIVVRIERAHRVGTTLQRLTITGSRPFSGEGLRLVNSEVLVSDVHLTRNGRGAHLIDSDTNWVRCEITENTSSGGGGGMLVEGFGSNQVHNTLIAHNFAGGGGGVMLSGGNLLLRNSILVANGATHNGGTVYAQTHPALATELRLLNTVVAHTTQDVAFFINDPDVTLDFKGTVLFDHPEGLGAGYFIDPSGPYSNLKVDPKWLGGWPNGVFTADDLYLAPDSLLRDAGWGEGADADGSPLDIGLHGGPYARVGFYLDSDRDDLLDGWEARYGLPTDRRNTHEDPDGDGLTNTLEQLYRLDPTRADTDGDGIADFMEIAEGSDPRDPFDPNGVAQVPAQIRRLDMAILRAPDHATIALGEGEFEARVSFIGKSLRLVGEGVDKSILNAKGFGPALSLVDGEREDSLIEALTVTGGVARRGGGVLIDGASATLRDVRIAANEASTGGGLYARNAQTFLDRVRIEDNLADSSGGGLFLAGGALIAQDLQLLDNEASTGAGVAFSSGGQHTFLRTTVSGNTALSDGGGMDIVGEPIVNIHNSLIVDNSATSGGGLHLTAGEVSLERCTLAANRATEGGGIAVYAEPQLSLDQVILAYTHRGGGIYLGSRKGPLPVITRSLMWANEGGDLVAGFETPDLLEDTLLEDPIFTAEPWFDAWVPSTLHLAPSSPAAAKLTPTGAHTDELGAYGGPDADTTWAEDQDDDGLPDGWERLWGPEPEELQPEADLDLDGLSCAQEYHLGLGPTRADTDDDGISDSDEILAGTDPRTPDAERAWSWTSPSTDLKDLLPAAP